MVRIDEEDVYKFTYKVAWQKYSDREVFYIQEIESRDYMYFENAAYHILCLIDKHLRVKEIVERVSDLFDTEYQVVLKDTEDLISELYQSGIIEKVKIE